MPEVPGKRRRTEEGTLKEKREEDLHMRDEMDWMRQRHSVRQYDGQPLSEETEKKLQTLIARTNEESGQHFQLLVNEPEAFSGRMARYGTFRGVVNYIALVGNDARRLGYYGERLVEFCTKLGLKTCWVGLTYSKERNQIEIPEGDSLHGVIALGTSEESGKSHSVKSLQTLCPDLQDAPDWFKKGVEGAQLAPTAVNQQKFRFYWNNGQPQAKKGFGFYTDMDLGIAEYHFDRASGHPLFVPGKS